MEAVVDREDDGGGIVVAFCTDAEAEVEDAGPQI